MSLFIGKNLIEKEETDSTNNFAKELLSNTRPAEGTLIVTSHQTNGRGQAGNTWEAERGKNLTLSVILYPDFLEADKQFYLNMAVSLAVRDFCEDVLKDELKIKWPNDIFYLNKKVGGILIENTIQGLRLGSSVVGIGLNINQTDFSKNITNAASFSTITGQVFDLVVLRDKLCDYLEKYYMQLRQLHFNFLDKAYTVALYRYQQTHEFLHAGKTLRGEIVGVAKDGKLRIESSGKEHRYMFKEIEYVF